MTKRLCAGAAVIALAAGGAFAQELRFTPGEGDFNWDSLEAFAAAHDYSGQELSITGTWTGDDKALFESVIAYFEEATGASVEYSGSESHEQDIVIAFQANSASDITIFPQPGLMADMAARGYLTPLDAETGDWLLENYAAGQSWVDLGTHAGPDGDEALYGFFYKVDVKSLVWYVPEIFDEFGYDLPETMEDLKALTDQIAADGATPWCIGLGSMAATGWPATDWVEDMMLRTQSPAVYDRWVSNDMPFDDPAVVNAIEEFGWFVRNPDFVHGGAEAAATTDFRDSAQGLFGFPPDCLMHRQAQFIPTFFPEGTVLGEDVDFFYFPAFAEADLGKPVLGGGTGFSLINDTPVARGFFEFLKTPIAHEIWMAQSGFLTPYTGVSPDAYANDTWRGLGEILTNASTFRFDASDLMPGEIGAGAFWTGMVDYVSGTPAAEVAASIQARWDDIN